MKAVRFVDSVKPLLVPIEQVKQHPGNPNNGDDENLMESIQINGFYTVCTANANTGHIIVGNTRYRALLALGATHIPIAWVDKDDMGETRILVGDNASSRRAVMDAGLELGLLKQLQESDLGLTGSSVTHDEYERMLMEQAQLIIPEEEQGGFGRIGALNQFQIVIDFSEDEDRRDEVFADLAQVYDNVRTVNL